MLLTRLSQLAAALWWGSLSAIGFMAVPLLFKHLPSAAAAGQMAARLFSAQAWLSVACGVVLLVCARQQGGDVADAPGSATRRQAAQGLIVLTAVGLLLALLQEFGVAPRIVARHNLALWHGLGTAMYVGQWLCAGALLWRVTRPTPLAAPPTP